MCGIAGVLTTNDSFEAEVAIQKMIEASKHRGPDACGFIKIPLQEGNLFLGHTRLSIIDLTEVANQPMKDPLTNSWIVYNGEIYNFRELRAELEKLGVTFRSKSDTEVLLQALVKWGEGALTKLSGMYAFGFWDGIRKELLLARDPLGIKPLYYFDIPGLFIFGSEVKVIQASNLRNFTLDKDAVKSFLTYGAVIRPLTIINEIKELLPGNVLKVSENGEIKKITKRNLSIILNESEKGNSVSFSEAVNSIKSTLLNSVKSHLVSDVPVGVFLSGGIDSSLISLFVSNSNEEQDVKLLTVGFPEEEFSEVKYSRIVAEKTHRDHEVIFVTPDRIQNLLPNALSSMDQPTVDGINTYVISNVASSLGIKVLLSGLGGDELFGGYTTYRNVPLLLQYHKIFPKLARFMVKIRGSNLSKWHKVSQLSNIDTLEEIYLLHRCIRWNGASGGLQNGDALPDNFFIPHEIRETLLSGDDGDDFKNITLLELNFYMGNQLLRDSDVFSMANSVELRVPFLDIDVVRRALTLPKSYHQQFWKGKKITREILKEICPGLPLNRKKMGFTFPWEHWLRGDLKEMISETIFNKKLYEKVGLDFQKGKEILEDFQNNHPLVSWFQIWSLFVLLNWQERNRISV